MLHKFGVTYYCEKFSANRESDFPVTMATISVQTKFDHKFFLIGGRFPNNCQKPSVVICQIFVHIPSIYTIIYSCFFQFRRCIIKSCLIDRFDHLSILSWTPHASYLFYTHRNSFAHFFPFLQRFFYHAVHT